MFDSPTIITPPVVVSDGRSRALDRVLNSSRLPTPPVIAMRIVQATSRTDSTTKEIGELLRQDPAICAQVLKAINSCVYALAEPVTTVERAVLLLGMNTVRSIVLTLSLPAMRLDTTTDRPLRDYLQSSVSGAIIARELAVRMRTANVEDDLLCGLLRDLGALALRQVFPQEAAAADEVAAELPFGDRCRLEREAFGVDHADVSAELLVRWRLPELIAEPIRYHHEPHRLPADADPDLVERAHRLAFVEALANLDVIAQQPVELESLLKTAATRYGMPPGDMVEFLEGIVPKVEAFTRLLSDDVGRCPDFAATLAAGCDALVGLTVEAGRASVAATVRASAAGVVAAPAAGPPAFVPAFVDDFPPAGCRLDGYHLTHKIGRGAMGCVFRGYDPSLDRVVAVKLMTPAGGGDVDGYRQRFIREARNAASVRHENVVSIYGVKDAGPLAYLVMEFVDGRSLDAAVAADGPLPIDRFRAAAGQIAAGLAAAHAARIVHRDVKPDNILLDRATGAVKLTDFGLARGHNDVRLTVDGSLIGTPLFMSPEQAAGRPADHRSDLFSLGSVLYFTATGRPPFGGTTMLEVLRQVHDATPVPPRHLRPDLPEWVDALVMRLLAKAPDERFQSADEVGRFLHDPDATSGSGRRKWSGWRALFGG